MLAQTGGAGDFIENRTGSIAQEAGFHIDNAGFAFGFAHKKVTGQDFTLYAGHTMVLWGDFEVAAGHNFVVESGSDLLIAAL